MAQPQKRAAVPEGLAWEVVGSWEISGKPILKGDAVTPGALLQPSVSAETHSIEILLPDGQRLVYECYTVSDCERGFRIPALFGTMDPAAVEFLNSVREVLFAHRNDAHGPAAGGPPVSRLPHDESLSVLDQQNQVRIGGLASKLPNGHYTYNLRPLDPSQPRRFHLSLQKDGPLITVPLPSAGIYVVTILDDLNTQRIELFVAAITPEQKQRIAGHYDAARKLMAGWNENYVSWPTHDLQRAYLEWLVRGQKALAEATASQVSNGSEAKLVKVSPAAAGQGAGSSEPATNPLPRTAEPIYSPKPGMFPKSIEVTLRCQTPGATIHFTVDGSQPMTMSSVYQAPIVVKGTELTIKAFASTPGKRDSPVVTGNFRIEEKPD